VSLPNAKPRIPHQNCTATHTKKATNPIRPSHSSSYQDKLSLCQMDLNGKEVGWERLWQADLWWNLVNHHRGHTQTLTRYKQAGGPHSTWIRLSHSPWRQWIWVPEDCIWNPSLNAAEANFKIYGQSTAGMTGRTARSGEKSVMPNRLDKPYQKRRDKTNIQHDTGYIIGFPKWRPEEELVINASFGFWTQNIMKLTY